MWDQISTGAPTPTLQPWSGKGLIGADGSQLSVHGVVQVEMELLNRKVPTDVVVVTPLIAEGILGLDFLQKQ